MDEWQQMRLEERMAGALLADILGADWFNVEPRDLGGERVHDFDLVASPQRAADRGGGHSRRLPG